MVPPATLRILRMKSMLFLFSLVAPWRASADFTFDLTVPTVSALNAPEGAFYALDSPAMGSRAGYYASVKSSQNYDSIYSGGSRVARTGGTENAPGFAKPFDAVLREVFANNRGRVAFSGRAASVTGTGVAAGATPARKELRQARPEFHPKESPLIRSRSTIYNGEACLAAHRSFPRESGQADYYAVGKLPQTSSCTALPA